jgi:hypothetical protein
MTTPAFVLFGDVVRSRAGRAGGDRLAARAHRRSRDRVSALCQAGAVRIHQGDELQALLRIEADPFEAVWCCAERWTSVPCRCAGSSWPALVEPGRGPATERTGPAFLAARTTARSRPRARRDGLVVRVGDGPSDDLLAELGPLLADLLADLTERQRSIARLMLVDRLRQSEVAERVGVSRATISVMAERARIRRIEGLLAVLRRIVADGIAAREAP